MPRRLAALCDLLGDQCRRILILVLRRKKSCNIEISKAPLKNAKKKKFTKTHVLFLPATKVNLPNQLLNRNHAFFPP